MKNEKQILIGRRLRAAREEAGLSQEELGSLIGFSAMGLSHLENGDRKIKLEDLQKIAETLKIEITYLLEPITKFSFPTTFYRRGEEDITEEQRKAEDKALKELDDFVNKL